MVESHLLPHLVCRTPDSLCYLVRVHTHTRACILLWLLFQDLLYVVVLESCAVLLAGLVLGDLRFEFESDMEGSEETSPK